MARRRLTLADHVRRRWRVLGAIAVLLLGALLVVGVTDRGHDPLWEVHVEGLDSPTLAPDGSAAYALVRNGTNLVGVAAFDGDDGTLRWSGPLPPNATRAVLAAGHAGVAVANDFPGALLTSYAADGRVLWQVPLEGNPVAVAVDGTRVALGLNAPTNPVLLFEGSTQVATLRNPSPLRALDMRAGVVAAAGLHGEVLVWHANGTQALNVTLPMSIRSMRLSGDGTTLLVGGARLDAAEPTEARGTLALLDVGSGPAIRWQHETFGPPVGLVGLDRIGHVALAVEDAPPTTTLRAYDADDGATRWTARIDGSVSRDDTGSFGGAALSPSGDLALVSTLRGELTALDARDGSVAWTYRAEGSTSVVFATDAADRVLVGARMLENRPVDTLLLFSAQEEPLLQRAGLLAIGLSMLAAGAFGAVLGVGFWRARRSY